MKVYIVSYFYPDGNYAGILGVYKNEVMAKGVADFENNNTYPDCNFVVTEAELE